MSIGQRIKEAREKRDLTQRQLAEKIGVAASQLCRWERTEEPRIAAVRRIAKALRVRAADLIG
jgi:transcriptional regulator with XRE-family HTH domain